MDAIYNAFTTPNPYLFVNTNYNPTTFWDLLPGSAATMGTKPTGMSPMLVAALALGGGYLLWKALK
jgi:hypothetical protein